jgi:hypothetical protein
MRYRLQNFLRKKGGMTMDNEKFVTADYVWMYLMSEAQQAGHEGFAEQAWLYVTEFSPDYMSE